MHIQQERFKRSLPVKFTDDELRGKADQLADNVARRESLEEEKKRVTADYKARIDDVTSGVNLLARHITEKCEYQQVECRAFLDEPEYGKKTIWRCDTGEKVGVETMTPADRQIVMQFERTTDEHNVNPLETPAPNEDGKPLFSTSQPHMDDSTGPEITEDVQPNIEPEHDTAGRDNEGSAEVVDPFLSALKGVN